MTTPNRLTKQSIWTRTREINCLSKMTKLVWSLLKVVKALFGRNRPAYCWHAMDTALTSRGFVSKICFWVCVVERERLLIVLWQRNRVVSCVQCDQMARLFIQDLAIYNKENLPKRKQIVPKWVHNFAKY